MPPAAAGGPRRQRQRPRHEGVHPRQPGHQGRRRPEGLPAGAAVAKQPPGSEFTRLDLANAIASKDNPLTARVIVNRVWAWHFGRGIVNTPSNFGKLGDRAEPPRTARLARGRTS